MLKNKTEEFEKIEEKLGESQETEKKPSWIKMKPKEVEELVVKLAREGNSPAKIGLILRDKHGIPKVKLLGRKVEKILKSTNVKYITEKVEIEKKITNKTKAILVVHNYGNICDMEPIVKIAKKNNIYLIEDVAEAPFTKYKGKSAGTFGDLGCFSFQATKTITTGEGGAVITDNPELEKKMRKIRSHGLSARGRYWHDEIGYNFRLTNVQAAIGVAQLEKLDIILQNKKRIYDLYKKNLSGIDGIAFQKITHGSEPIIWAVAVKINQEKFRVSRDEMIDKLLEKNIETRPGFYPFHAMPLYNTDVLPMADEISKNIISLPSFAALKDEEIEYICSSLKSFMK